MHQTTVRFGADLWQALEREADLLGVSVAQYLRDAALARLAFAEGQRETTSPYRPAWGQHFAADNDRLAQLRRRVDNEAGSSQAVRAQGRIARQRAQRLREESERLRRLSAHGRDVNDPGGE